MDPIRFRCPDCDQALRVAAEKAGRKVRCNRCSNVVVVPRQEETAEEAEEPGHDEPAPETLAPSKKRTRTEPAEDEPATEEDYEEVEEPTAKQKRKALRKGRAAAWRLARLGLLLLMIASALALLNMLSGGLFYLLPMRTLIALANTLIVLGVVAAVVLGLLHVASYTLCLFAPPESESKPFAIAALIATVLTYSMSAYLTVDMVLSIRGGFSSVIDGVDYSDPKAVERKIKEDQEKSKEDQERLRERLKDPKEREKYLKELQEQSKKAQEQSKKAQEDIQKSLKNLQSTTVRLSILRTVGSLLSGIYLISVPLLLRSFCRDLKLVKLEPNCDSLLKIGAGLIGLAVAAQLLGAVVMRLGGAVGGLNSLLWLAYAGLSLVLTYQIWRAMPAPR